MRMASSFLCRPSPARCLARRAWAAKRAARNAGLAGPAGYRLDGARVDRKVEVYASVRPKRVEAEVGYHVDCRHPERSALA